jgi:hypothetical protein
MGGKRKRSWMMTVIRRVVPGVEALAGVLESREMVEMAIVQEVWNLVDERNDCCASCKVNVRFADIETNKHHIGFVTSLSLDQRYEQV